MRSLAEARNVCERYHPGLCAALADISLAEREAPGGPRLRPDILTAELVFAPRPHAWNGMECRRRQGGVLR
jgi:hypothetical protein